MISLSPATSSLDARVSALRAFNRFYTPVMGLLGRGLLRTPYSLTEARVLYEIAQVREAGVADLRPPARARPGAPEQDARALRARRPGGPAAAGG